ncbi:LptF/LptG family permease [Carboxylicivirga sp. RSCT41]|uniref:LptF/LptG family permease n=1 Tax=Carboxylicivirga agarovorans TaxID=3417570 RepID=UPI003D341B53
MKKLHLFTLKSFIGPLISTFFISLFVLLMQILWQYIDILVGKGLDIATISQLLFYSILQVMPMALPLAILLASLMTFGNMGENYELTAIKASGVSLLKCMKPLIILTIILSMAAYAFSDNVMPWANLKFYSLMYSIKTHQPELEIKEKEFTKLGNYSIKAENKNKESGALEDLMIYDHSNSNNPGANTTIADVGYLKMDENSNMMRITLHNGIRYEENAKNKQSSLTTSDQQFYRRDKFKRQITLIDFQNKELNVDEAGYAGHNKMKNYKQLKGDILKYRKEQNEIVSQISQRFKHQFEYNNTAPPTPAVNSYIENQNHRQQLVAINNAKRKTQEQLLSLKKELAHHDLLQRKEISHQVEINRKLTLPFTCIIFFFIGSSLGAIIRKGGFGMPVVIAIILFIVFYMLDTFGCNMAKKGALPVVIGTWLSSAILLIIALLLSYQSSTDSSLLNIENIRDLFRKKLRFGSL